jgi:fermentation-respiration switch protein FrsA (DUF1100 family)
MGSVTRNGLGHSQTLEQRQHMVEEASQQRLEEFAGGQTRYTGGTVHELTEDTHPIQREFYDFYRTPRGEFTPERSSPMQTTHPTLASNVKFLNFYPFNDIETISPRPMLFITGDEAHSREFSEEAYKLAGEPKQLLGHPRSRPRRSVRPGRPDPLRRARVLLRAAPVGTARTGRAAQVISAPSEGTTGATEAT